MTIEAGHYDRLLKEQYDRLEGKTWKCSECPKKINRDTMNPYLPGMCQKCQKGMCGF
jgi:hypothetical protein